MLNQEDILQQLSCLLESFDLLDRIASDPAFNISKEDLQKVMKPENYIGRAAEQTTEFLDQVIKPILSANRDVLGLEAEINV